MPCAMRAAIHAPCAAAFFGSLHGTAAPTAAPHAASSPDAVKKPALGLQFVCGPHPVDRRSPLRPRRGGAGRDRT